MFYFLGTEPLSYYLVNGFLNFNFVFVAALVSLPFAVSVLFKALTSVVITWHATVKRSLLLMQQIFEYIIYLLFYYICDN